MKYPNLFKIGTNELTQDIFFTWLTQAGDKKYEPSRLQELSRKFIKFLIDTDINIETVEVQRQWKKIDITLTVNNKYLVIIEDKVGSGVHNNQLERYYKVASEYAKQNGLEVKAIYIKIEDECGETINHILNQGYKYVARNNIIELLRKYKDIDNNIFQDYYNYLEEIEKLSLEYKNNMYAVTKNYTTCKGFYKQLEKDIRAEIRAERKEFIHWGYIHQTNHGSYDLWYYPINKENYYLYIQLIINNRGEAKVVLKTCAKNLNYLYSLYRILYENAKRKNIKISKPIQFKSKGQTSTVAILEDFDFGKDYNHIRDNLRKIENFLEELDIYINI